MSDPTPEELAKTKQLMLYAGPPAPTDDIEKWKAEGGKIVFFLKADDDYKIKPDEAAVRWESDEYLKNWLLDNIQLWQGGQVGGTTEKRAEELAAVLLVMVNLHNFDAKSNVFLSKDGEPTRNALKNFRYQMEGISLKRARNSAKGACAIIIAAGPSLNDQWAALRRISEMSHFPKVVIVCGRSYKKAMKHGVMPDFVVEVEQFQWDERIWTFAPEPPDFTILCGPITACPGVFSAWPNKRMIMMLTDHNMAKMFAPEGWKVGEDSIDGGNSILHHMVNVADWLGCETICVAGADLAYPPGTKETHADGTFHDWGNEMTAAERQKQDALMVPSTDGGMVLSSPGYKNFGTFLEIQINRIGKRRGKPVKFINFAPRGQKIAGMEYQEIDTWNGPPSVSPPPSSSGPSFVPALSSSASDAPSTSFTSTPTVSASESSGSAPTTTEETRP